MKFLKFTLEYTENFEINELALIISKVCSRGSISWIKYLISFTTISFLKLKGTLLHLSESILTSSLHKIYQFELGTEDLTLVKGYLNNSGLFSLSFETIPSV